MPPAIARRMLTPPLWLALAVVWTLASPVLFVVAVLATAFTRDRQPVRLVYFILIYLLREACVILACGVLWVISGAGRAMGTERIQSLHYRLLGWLIHGLLSEVLRSLRVTLHFDPTPRRRGRSWTRHDR